MPKSFLNKPGYPLGLRDNNPGNIREGDTWQGQIGVNQGFVVFQDISWGLRALAKDLGNIIDRGINTPEEIIYHFAPPSENDTESYLTRVLTISHFTRNQLLTSNTATIKALIRGIINVELGPSYAALITDADINEAFALLGWEITPTVAAAGAGIAFLLLGTAVVLLTTGDTKKKARKRSTYYYHNRSAV